MLLVVLEHDRGAMAEAAREALTVGRSLAGQMGVPLHAALIGADNAEMAAEAGAYGAEAVYTVVHEVLADFGPEAWGEAAAELVRRLSPGAVLAGGSERGNEVMAQVAARLDLPLVANCTEVQPGGGAGEWTMTRQQWGGSLLEDARLQSDLPLLTTGLHAVAAQRTEAVTEPLAEAVEVDLDQSLARTMVKDRVVLEAGVTLSTAPVVIGGGRGVGSVEAFAPLEELAGLLGGKVGCSRAVTNNGWRPHSDQVGPDRNPHHPRDLHRLGHLGRHPALGGGQGQQAHPGHQYRPRGQHGGQSRLGRHRRPPPDDPRHHRRDKAPPRLTGLSASVGELMMRRRWSDRLSSPCS